MRIVLFIVLMGVLGFVALVMLPEPNREKVEEKYANLPVEQVNKNVRNVTPENALPGPDIDSTEISRLPDLPAPVSKKKEEKLFTLRSFVVNAPGILKSGETTIIISGIISLKLDTMCVLDDGDDWPCGRFARTAMRGLTRNHKITCEKIARGKYFTKCYAGNRDIGEWLVEQGWAENYGDNYIEAMKTAKRAKKGMWRGKAP